MRLPRIYSILLLLAVLVAVIILIQFGTNKADGETAQPAAGPLTAQQAEAAAPAPQLTPRDLYKSCGRALATLENRTRDLVHIATGKQINVSAVRSTQEQSRNQFRKLENSYSHLYGGLTAEQQSRIRTNVHQLDRLRARIDTHMNRIDQIVAAPALDRRQLMEEATLVERTTRAYRVHFQKMGDELGIDRD